MLTTIAITAACSLIGAAIVQQMISMAFQKQFLQSESKPLPENHQTKAAVIMCVRGCDPSLKDALVGVLNQAYKNYEVHLVVDHQSDQAWELVHQLKDEYDANNVLRIQEMREPGENCSLKCHSIVQAIRGIEKGVVDNRQAGKLPEYIALLDADVTPHPTWLSELLGPLLTSTVGGVTGNQWFEPPRPSGVGSLCRSVWNGGCMILSIHFNNPWAGSFAMRMEDLLKSNLITTWSHSVVDDGPIASAVHGLGKQVVVAPSLLMVNRERCTFAYANRWTTRMLTWSRMHESTFFISVFHAIFSNTVMLSNFIVLFFALAMLHWPAVGISLTALIVSGVLSTWAYTVGRKCVEHSCRLRGETLELTDVGRLHSVFWMIAPAHLIYGISCLRAILINKIKWREITYHLPGGTKVRRLNYQPFQPRSENSSNVSI